MTPTRRSVVTVLGVTLLCADAYPFNVYRLGGGEGNPWEAAVSAAPGRYQVVNPDGTVIRSLLVSTPTDEYETWEDTLAVPFDTLGTTRLRPFYVPDTLNLARDGVRDRIEKPLSLSNLHTSGQCHNIASHVQSQVFKAFDGDLKTASSWRASRTEGSVVFVQNSIADFGTNYPVNRMRLFPRLGRDNPNIDQILDEMAPPKLRKQDLPEEDRSDFFLPWLELAGAPSGNFAESCWFAIRDVRPWFRWIGPGDDAQTDSRFTILLHDRENQEVVVDIRFPTQNFQFVAFRPISPNRLWEVAEFQVFGEGFVPRAVYTTAILDFGKPMAWGKIRWTGEQPDGTQILISTRSGTDPSPERYWLPSSMPGELTEIERARFELDRIDPANGAQATRDDEHWSFWSTPYPFADGLRDPTLAAPEWQDGTRILSPGPARYFQIQLIFLSTFETTASLGELEIQFGDPAAVRAVGEIWPHDVPRTESTTFTYVVRPEFDDVATGFDRLEVFTATEVGQVRSVTVDGNPVDADGVPWIEKYPPDIQADRIVVGFDKLQGDGDTFKPIEIRFDAHVVRYGTVFQGWVFDSKGGGVKQLIEAGDASVDFPGNALGVRTGDLGAELLTEVSAEPNPFTPNNDGVNDDVGFRFQVHEVVTPRVLSLSIYDLSGRLVRELERQSVIRGLYGEGVNDNTWDGRDDTGNLVAPGLYLYQISLDTDEGTEKKLGTIAVAY